MCEEKMISETSGIPLDEVMRRDLASSAKWVKITCVISLIITILGIIMFLLLSFAMTLFPQAGNFQMKIGFYVLVLYYILYIYPIIKGLHFVKRLKNACFTGSQSELEQAFAALRPCVVWFTVLHIIFFVLSYCFRIFELM